MPDPYVRSKRQSWGKRISDGLLPQPVVRFLWRPIIPGTVINGYSFVHFFSGVIFGLFTCEWGAALLWHTVWEMFQFAVGDNKWEREDLLYDIPLDTLMFMFGWYLSSRVRSKQ